MYSISIRCINCCLDHCIIYKKNDTQYILYCFMGRNCQQDILLGIRFGKDKYLKDTRDSFLGYIHMFSTMYYINRNFQLMYFYMFFPKSTIGHINLNLKKYLIYTQSIHFRTTLYIVGIKDDILYIVLMKLNQKSPKDITLGTILDTRSYQVHILCTNLVPNITHMLNRKQYMMYFCPKNNLRYNLCNLKGFY